MTILLMLFIIHTGRCQVNIQNILKVMKKIFFPPPVLTLLIAIPSYGLVIYALTAKSVRPAVAYFAYVLSAYAFVITVTGTIGIIYWIRTGIETHPFVRKMLSIPLLRRYIKEAVFRAEAALYAGFFINLLYAGIKLFAGAYYRSVWFGTLAVYYILLAVMRFSLLHHMRKRKKTENNKAAPWRRYRLCGMILLCMNWALTGIIVLVLHQNRGFEYPGVLIYAMAFYTFYATIMAARNVIKFRKYGSPILSAAKVINLTAALVSMLSLETAMLTQFGRADDKEFRQIMMAATGFGISAIVLGMAVYMIVHATKTIKIMVTVQSQCHLVKAISSSYNEPLTKI